MAEPILRGKVWYGRYKNHAGHWLQPRLGKMGKREAAEQNALLQAQADQVRRGLRPAPMVDADETFGDLVRWWITNRLTAAETSHMGGTVRKHLVDWDGDEALARLAPAAVTSGKVENFLHAKEREGLSPGTVNHLRSKIRQIVNDAIRSERFHGTNPITKAVSVRVVPEREHQFFQVEWCLPILQFIAPQHRNVTAVALYHGLRKGELFGLKKTDIDLQLGLIHVRRSHDRTTTKGRREKSIPIHPESVPYLLEAIESAPSEHVFVQLEGKRYRHDHDLSANVRAAMRRAGVGVTHYEHKCRKKDCGYVGRSAAGSVGLRCPTCDTKLWTVPQVVPLRFHDTRHTTASLLAMRGATVQAIQKYLRHSSSKMTERYMHLAPDYLRSEISRLSLGTPTDQEPAPETVPMTAAGGLHQGFGAPLVQVADHHRSSPSGLLENPQWDQDLALSGRLDLNQRPPVPQDRGAESQGVGSGVNPSTPLGSGDGAPFQPVDPIAPFGRDFGAPLVQGSRKPLRPGPALTVVSAPLLGVRDVARELGVCAATVYKLCDQGALTHVRVGVGPGGNSIRVTRADLDAFISSRRRGR